MSNRTEGVTSIAASKTDARVSRNWKPEDRNNILIEVRISAVTETNAIVFKLMESAGGGEFHNVGDQSEVGVTAMSVPSSDIANATDLFTETGHGKETGNPVIFNKGTTIPTGLTDGETYYMIWVSANTFRLAATYNQAVQGDYISISDDGVGTHLLYDASYEIRMVTSDTSDAAQLPTHEFVHVAVTTGVSDTVTVSKVQG